MTNWLSSREVNLHRFVSIEVKSEPFLITHPDEKREIKKKSYTMQLVKLTEAVCRTLLVAMDSLLLSTAVTLIILGFVESLYQHGFI